MKLSVLDNRYLFDALAVGRYKLPRKKCFDFVNNTSFIYK